MTQQQLNTIETVDRMLNANNLTLEQVLRHKKLVSCKNVKNSEQLVWLNGKCVKVIAGDNPSQFSGM